MAREITSDDDHIDTRDVLKLIEEWEDDPDYADQVASLKKLIELVEDYAEDSAQDGVFLIQDSCFEEYAQELAEDIGAINKSSQWPNYCIDWEWAARELQIDYSSTEWEGVTYWFR